MNWPAAVRFACVLGSALALPAPGAFASGAECDEAWIAGYGGPIATGPGAYRDTTLTLMLDPPWQGAFGEGEVRYRLGERWFSSRVHANAVMYASGSAHESVWIEGLPPGTPVSFDLLAEVTFEQRFDVPCGGSGCTPTTAAHVEADGGEFVEWVRFAFPPGISETRTLTLGLSRFAGQPFTLDYVWASGISHEDAHARVELRVTFAGLPSGARIASCLDRLPVASAPATWGALKARYR